MNKLFSILIMCTLASSAYSANWVDLGKSSDNNTQIYLDTHSVKPYTSRIALQTSYDSDYISGFVQHTYINDNKLRDIGWYYSKYFYIVDCNNKFLYSPSYIVYGFKDEVVESHRQPYFTARDFGVVFPETVGEMIVESICNYNSYGSTFTRPQVISKEELEKMRLADIN